jgi:hypothetical protein
MRGLAAYVLAGILTALALDFVAPPVGLGMAVGAPPAHVRPTQVVDRTHKGDRLRLPAEIGKQQAPISSPGVMIGCDPAYSPLLASARANIAGRCIAELAHPLAG